MAYHFNPSGTFVVPAGGVPIGGIPLEAALFGLPSGIGSVQRKVKCRDPICDFWDFDPKLVGKTGKHHHPNCFRYPTKSSSSSQSYQCQHCGISSTDRSVIAGNNKHHRTCCPRHSSGGTIKI
tara:strand:- start:3938 stop:4306 length:369 start_codon:yes stop_codon:yes gene_type:complete